MFKASDGSTVDALADLFLPPEGTQKNESARAVVLELPKGVAWLHQDITTEASHFLYLSQAAFDTAALITGHYAKQRAGYIIMCVCLILILNFSFLL